MSPPLRIVVPLLILIGGVDRCFAETTRQQRAFADFNVIGSAIKTYKVNTGELPPPEVGLKALIERPASLRADQRWIQVLLKLPSDPWNNPYRYLAGEGLEDGFGLYSCGPDGISATAGNDPDDLNSWSDKAPAEPSWASRWKLLALVGGAVVAAGSFMLGYRVAMKEARRGIL